jgi:hypothetical protein
MYLLVFSVLLITWMKEWKEVDAPVHLARVDVT